MIKDKIFISIASYNEEDLLMTIESAIINAEYPERVNFGVFCHTSEPVVEEIKYTSIKTIYAHYPNVLGIGISRLLANSLYDDEKYFLQIDAHMLFEKNWDSKIINNFINIQKVYEKPIISTYVPWWARMEDGSIINYSNDSDRTCDPMEYMSKIYQGHPAFANYYQDYMDKDYIEHCGIAGHFIFTTSDFMKEVPPDPEMIFSGEEETLSLRAWTRGYRIFCIKSPIVWHRNKGVGVLSPKDRMRRNAPLREHERFQKKQRDSINRVQDIMTGKIIGEYGAPSIELLNDYEKFAGVNFKLMYKENCENNN